MAKFFGTDSQIALQKRMLARHSWIKDTPEIANGGRTLNFLEPEITGWDQIQTYLEEDGVVALTAQPKEGLRGRLETIFGAGHDFPSWDVYFGEAERILHLSQDYVSQHPVPPGWKLECLTCPDAVQLEAIQALNQSTGVAPYPGFYTCSEVLPSMTACLWDQAGELVATSSVNARYHPESRFGGYVFKGSTSVAPSQRGGGLGKLVNAYVLIESHAEMGWKYGISQVASDNPASQQTITAAGFVRAEGIVTVGVLKKGTHFTR